MSISRVLVSFIVGSVIVLTMLAVGVNTFYDRGDKLSRPSPDFVEVEYLTPEEAARLLGEDPDKHRPPELPVKRPSQPSELEVENAPP